MRSYRDLPVRYSEFGACHRDEPSRSLEGDEFKKYLQKSSKLSANFWW
jgi:threonyl-tRNA synthetase